LVHLFCFFPPSEPPARQKKCIFRTPLDHYFRFVFFLFTGFLFLPDFLLSLGHFWHSLSSEVPPPFKRFVTCSFPFPREDVWCVPFSVLCNAQVFSLSSVLPLALLIFVFYFSLLSHLSNKIVSPISVFYLLSFPPQTTVKQNSREHSKPLCGCGSWLVLPFPSLFMPSWGWPIKFRPITRSGLSFFPIMFFRRASERNFRRRYPKRPPRLHLFAKTKFFCRFGRRLFGVFVSPPPVPHAGNFVFSLHPSSFPPLLRFFLFRAEPTPSQVPCP